MTPVSFDNPLPALDPTRLVRPRNDARFESLLRDRTGDAKVGPSGAAMQPEAIAASASDAHAASARSAAEDLISTTFVKPMLAAMRQDPFKSDLFHGGQAEELFGSRMDQILADRITRAARFPLVDAVYRQLMGTQAAMVNTHG